MSLAVIAYPKTDDTAQTRDQESSVGSELTIVQAYLARQLRGRLWGARIFLHRGGVVLQGRTTSYHVKQLAQHAVMKLVPLPIVANKIEVTSLPQETQS